MADNLKQTVSTIEIQIDPNGAAGSILAQNHQNILKDVLNKVGKYTGQSYTAQKNITGVYSNGQFSFNNNALDATGNLTFSFAQKTADNLDLISTLNTLTAGSIIMFKDFVGRASLYVYVSHTTNSTKVTYDIVLTAVTGNPNYTYGDSEEEICIFSFKALSGTNPNGFVTLATAQTITGSKTFTGATTNLNSDNVNINGALKVTQNSPVIIIQDLDSIGQNQFAFFSFRDSDNTETAWFGFGDVGNTDFNIRNTMGNVTIQNNLAYHAGNLNVDNIVYRTGDETIAGNKSFTGFASTTKTNEQITAGADANFITKGWSQANAASLTKETFTPTLTDAGGGATYSFSSATGRSTLIGDVCHFHILIAGITTSGTPTGGVTVGGLPQAQAVNGMYNVGISGGDVNFSAVSAEMLAANTIAITITETGSTSNSRAVYQDVTFTSGNILISGTYFVGS